MLDKKKSNYKFYMTAEGIRRAEEDLEKQKSFYSIKN